MKLCVCIPGPSDVDVLAQCRSAMDAGADMLELRLDLWHEHALNVLQDLIAGRAVPMVLTFRTWREGGELRAERAAYQKLLLRLMALGADYVDVEAWVGPAFVLTLLDTKSDTQILISSHLSEPPADLEAEIAQLCKLPAAYHKLAYPMTSSCDALEALHYARRHERLILVGMGEAGQSTRILGGWAGVPWTYVCMEEDAPLASGQLSLSCLDAMYRARSISPSTRVYGLIGDPVVSSIGHYCHNAVMQRLGVDVVYIKWAVRSPELPRFLRLARLLGIRGLSVTMPHKEAVIACVEDVSPIALQMRAVNTLTLLGTGWKGDNTDGVGALRALRRVAKAQNRSLLLLGAGGAARAIGHQAKMEGWRVTVCNRNEEKGGAFAAELGVATLPWDQRNQLAHQHAVVVQCTSLGGPSTPFDSVLDAGALDACTVAMDVHTVPGRTRFLRCAAQAGCRTVPGVEMFIEQAIAQALLWYAEGQAAVVEQVMREVAYAHVEDSSEHSERDDTSPSF